MCGSLRLRQRAEEHQQVDDPHDRQPQVGVPLGLGVLLALRDAEQVAGAGNGDEELVAPDHEPGRPAAGEARVAGALHDIERGGEQHVAAEGEDHGRGVQRPQPAEAGPRQVEVERGEGELPGDDVADDEAGNAPDHGGDGGDLDGAVHVFVRGASARPVSPNERLQDEDCRQRSRPARTAGRGRPCRDRATRAARRVRWPRRPARRPTPWRPQKRPAPQRPSLA